MREGRGLEEIFGVMIRGVLTVGRLSDFLRGIVLAFPEGRLLGGEGFKLGIILERLDKG
ncbi:hypothetical protein [Streptococcus dysgalactiae]|uniref:hypothetical protein n=1 Tax=Streptococcus dysgalactiae TaxID=1334 RepID=UPI001951B089|nr:hypothetical protein [Streptococcus dysgalactiae]